MPPTRPVVLVMEDDPALRDVLRALLESEDFVVDAVEDGIAGLARIAEGGVDLLLLDLMLPDLDGLEVCRRVRLRRDEVYLPVIMLTALSGMAQRHAGFAAGADDYVSKPFDASEMIDRVQVWWRTRQRLLADHERLVRQQEALREAERQQMTAQVDGIRLAARELAHLINNDLTVAVGLTELLLTQYLPDLPPALRGVLDQAAAGLGDATRHIEQLQRVVRVETQDTPIGPALDLQRSL
jgi:two-component system, OmpR family, phosphate regulon response regulator PhoB